MDLFAMNLDDFAPQPDFFPYFPVWQGKCSQLGLCRDKGQRRACRADWITRFRGHDEKAGITYADFGNEVLSGANQTDGSRILFLVAPAKAGVQGWGTERTAPCASQGQALGARFRGHDGKRVRVPSVELTPLDIVN
jgi:hypothetical protein